MRPRRLQLALAAGAVLGLAAAALAAAAPCVSADDAADASAPNASVLAPPQADEAAAAAGRCRIGSADLQQSPWRGAQLIDLRSDGERQAQPLPGALRLRRSDLAPGLLSGLDRPVLLLGSGTDDLSLERHCLQLAAALSLPLAVLGGGAPAWWAAQPEAQASATAPLSLNPAGLVALLADPGAHVLVAESALPEGLQAQAQLYQLEPQPTARSLRRALQPALAAAARDGGSVAVVLAQAAGDQASLTGALAAPVWLYAEGPQPLLDWAQRQRAQLADRAPLAPETCRWN